MPGPQDKLEQVMLNRPVKVSGDVQYPTESAPQGPYQRFFGTAMGLEDQQPGDLPSALGAAASVMPLGGISKAANAVSEEGLIKSMLERAMDEGISTNNRLHRTMARGTVRSAYNELSKLGAVAPQEELSNLNQQVDALKAGSLKAAPTGLDSNKYHVNIINKLMAAGYPLKPEESSKLAELVQLAGLRTGAQLAPRGTGDYVRFIKGNLVPNSPLKRALNNITNWSDGELMGRVKNGPRSYSPSR